MMTVAMLTVAERATVAAPENEDLTVTANVETMEIEFIQASSSSSSEPSMSSFQSLPLY
jgi:hypothetical protein